MSVQYRPAFDESSIDLQLGDSDRFSFGRYFYPVPLKYPDLKIPMLSDHRRQQFRALLSKAIRPVEDMFKGRSYQLPDLLKRNGIAVQPVASNGGASRFLAAVSVNPEMFEKDFEKVLLGMSEPEIGYLFLDRTRIRNAGVAIGEHVFALSLGPAEEVVLEQKTYSKSEASYEEESLRESEKSSETDSSFSTEIQDGLQKSESSSFGAGLSAGVGVTIPIENVPLNANVGGNVNISEASQVAASHSVRTSSAVSRKVAAKYRSSHKVTFKLSNTAGYESSSRRLIRNPNRFTPINLHYFKILRRLELARERYGVRLCWRAMVREPGFDVLQRLAAGKAEIVRNFGIPEAPTPPVPEAGYVLASTEGRIDEGHWGALGDMRADILVVGELKDGCVWDRNEKTVLESLKLNFTGVDRKYWYKVIGAPVLLGNKVGVTVHIGIESQFEHILPWVNNGEIRASFSYGTVPGADSQEYRKRLAEWQQAKEQWAEDSAAAKQAAQKKSDEWEKEQLANLSPMNELLARVIHGYFPARVRDEAREVLFWHEIFDWEEASCRLYPGWWTGVNYTSGAAADIVNAGWAAVYIPIKIGKEAEALRWIYRKQMSGTAPAEDEAAFAAIKKELEDFRSQRFSGGAEVAYPAANGQVQERYETLGSWTELMPTDGTHLEIVESVSQAADAYRKKEIDDAVGYRAAVLEGHGRDNGLKQKAMSGGDPVVTVALAQEGGVVGGD